MPTTDDKAIVDRDRSGSGLRRRLTLAFAAVLCGLAACTPPKEAATAPAGVNAPIAVEKLSAPIALAPSLTGRPTKAAAAKPAAPPPKAAAATTPAGAVAGPPPVRCPLGTIGLWSPPDVVGTAVYICRRLNSQQ